MSNNPFQPMKSITLFTCVLVGSGIGPLDADGKRLMKEAIEGPLTGRKLGG